MIRLTQALKAWLKKRHAHFQWLIPFSSVPIVRPMIPGIQANIMRYLNKQGKKMPKHSQETKKLTETES